MSLILPPPVSTLLDAQHGVVTVDQLGEALSPGRIRTELRARRWSKPVRGVVVTHNGDLTPEQRIWAALLQCPPGSAMSGPTAAALDGYRLPSVLPPEPVHVTIPCGHRRPIGIAAEVHWSRFLDDADVHPARAPRRTRIARSILDWGAWQTSERAVRTIVLSAVQQRITSPGQLRSHLDRRGHCRHHRLLEESIDDAEGGIASVPEREFSMLVRGAGLPKPTRQSVRIRPGGRLYLDVEWRDFGYAAEIEGAHHFLAGTREADLDRYNELVILGDRVLQFTSFAVRRKQQVVVDVVTRALRSQGWSG